MYAQQRRLPAHSELIFARGTCFGLRSSSVQAIYFSCKWLTLGSFFVYAITITNILGGFVGLSFEEANVNSRCFALFCNGANEWSATPFLGLNSLVVIGVWLKAGLAQTNKSIGWGSLVEGFHAPHVLSVAQEVFCFPQKYSLCCPSMTLVPSLNS